MLLENFERILRGFTQRTPFRPFTVELINGRQFAVEHPEALIIRNGMAVYIAPADGALSIFDHEFFFNFTGSTEIYTTRSTGV